MTHYRDSLVALLKPFNPAVAAEVGVHRGRLSERLLRDFPGLLLYMVDPYLPHPEYPDQAVYRLEAAERTKFAVDRRAMLLLKSVDAPRSITRPLDAVFIDGDHAEQSVADDIRAWWPLVRPGGFFGGHDYGKADTPGVQVAVDAWSAQVGASIHVADGNIWWTVKP